MTATNIDEMKLIDKGNGNLFLYVDCLKILVFYQKVYTKKCIKSVYNLFMLNNTINLFQTSKY